MISDVKPTVLIADDQADVREALRLLLKSEGLASVGVADPAAALEAVRRREFACALIDCNYSRDTTSGEEGLELLERLRQLSPELPVVAMTAWGNVPLTVSAMRRGAADFIEKPWDNARLLSVLRAQIALAEGAASSAGWRRRTRCCAARRARIASPNRRRCAACWRWSSASRPATPTYWCWARTAPARA